MALQEAQQFFALLTTMRDVLVALPAHPSVDAVCSGLALGRLLNARGVRSELVAPGFTIPKTISWLPDVQKLQTSIPPLGKLLLQIDLGAARCHALAHDSTDGKLTIHVTPTTGTLSANTPVATSVTHRFDAAIVVGAQELSALGPLHNAGRDLFFRVPVVAIDHHPGNERFGTVNLVTPSATSIAEIVFDLFGEERRAIDETTATYLLTGVISATRSFKQESVSPRALAITADLMALGARREEIVKHLYRTKSVETLRLWGRALARLKSDSSGLVWTVVGTSDYTNAGAGPDDVPDIIDELLAFAPEAAVALVLYETPDRICGALETRATHNAALLASSFEESAGTHRAARFCVRTTTLPDAERTVVANIKAALLGQSQYVPSQSS